MIDLKPLPVDASRALELAERYRQEGEAEDAESVCLDVLALEPDNREALLGLLRSRVDLLERELPGGVERARELLPRLNEYEQRYYAGLICERQAKVLLRGGGPRSGALAYEWFRGAMEAYEDASRLEPERPEPILRWNSCARTLNRTPHCAPRQDSPGEHGIE